MAFVTAAPEDENRFAIAVTEAAMLSYRLALLLMTTLAVPAWSAEHAHQHGVVSLNATLEGEVLSLDLDAPLDSLLGFERAPRTEAERAAAAALLKTLGPGTSMWRPNPEARCVLAQAKVEAPVLQQPQAPAGEHADLEAGYQFRCAQPAQLTGLQHELFQAFARLQRIEWQFALPSGQGKRTVKRPEALLPLKR
ncbi:hypothetical protein DBR42_24125 [Pelomonas sp. HMWF004]|nr:hypothetical protein DBR42_24125 [Pelomonas sp. HMWF004]